MNDIPHTPAPWSLKLEKHGDFIVAADGREIAQVFRDADDAPTGNLLLMYAAPDMYDSLVMAQTHMRAEIKRRADADATYDVPMLPALKAVTDAIRRAKGGWHGRLSRRSSEAPPGKPWRLQYEEDGVQIEAWFRYQDDAHEFAKAISGGSFSYSIDCDGKDDEP